MYPLEFSGVRYLIKRSRMAAQCPYWQGHARYMNRTGGHLLFNKWNKRPTSAYKLYWRLHPDEYEAANRPINRG
jgi:hypothetical protein